MRDYRKGVRRKQPKLPPSDKAIVDIEQIYLKHYSPIFNNLYTWTRDIFLAEDLTQDTFFKAFRALDRFDGQNVGAWLNTIARNAFLSYVKRSEVKTKYSFDPSLKLERIETSRDEIKEFEGNDNFNYMKNLLNPSQSQVVQLFYGDQLTENQIGFKLGIPKLTVASRLFRAREKLRQHLIEAA